MAEVSICIPAYRQTEFLRKTLSSVREQKFTDYEIILTDDSPDHSVEQLAGEFDFGNRLQYFRNSSPLGSPANWNAGLKKASGRLIKIMHHDDYFTSPDSLNKFVSLLDENKKSDFAFSSTRIYFADSGLVKNHRCSSKNLEKIAQRPEHLFFRNYIGAPSATIFRNNTTAFFDERLTWLVDVDWYIMHMAKNNHVAMSNETLICTVHGTAGQVTQNVNRDRDIQVREHLYLFEKIINKNSDLKKYSFFFQLLFYKYNVNTMGEVFGFYPVKRDFDSFFEEVLEKKNTRVFSKKVKYWLQRFSVNDYLFLLRKKLK